MLEKAEVAVVGIDISRHRVAQRELSECEAGPSLKQPECTGAHVQPRRGNRRSAAGRRRSDGGPSPAQSSRGAAQTRYLDGLSSRLEASPQIAGIHRHRGQSHRERMILAAVIGREHTPVDRGSDCCIGAAVLLSAMTRPSRRQLLLVGYEKWVPRLSAPA
jgi:hypothetical protein